MVAYHGRNLAGCWMDGAFPHFNETATRGNIIGVGGHWGDIIISSGERQALPATCR